MTGRLRCAMALGAVVAITGCGDDGEEPGPSAGADVSYSPAAEDELVVAKVNGEPILGSCVATQAEAKGITRQAALQECIDFELLAQAARDAGLLSEPDVREVARKEAVRALLDHDFYARFSSPDDVPREDPKKLWDRGMKHYYNRLENRTSLYCRGQTAKVTPTDPVSDGRAKRAAMALYRRASERTDWDEKSFIALCREVDRELTDAQISMAKPGQRRLQMAANANNYVKEFVDATFSVAAVGQVSKPVRTQWGWDVVLLLDILPARSATFEEALPEIRERLFSRPDFAFYRRARFARWLDGAVADVAVEAFPDRIPETLRLSQTP